MITCTRILVCSLSLACCVACESANDSNSTTPQPGTGGVQPPAEGMGGAETAGAKPDVAKQPGGDEPNGETTDPAKQPAACAPSCPKPDPGGDTTGFDDPPSVQLEGVWSLPWALDVDCETGPQDVALEGAMRLRFEPADDSAHVRVGLVGGGGIPGFGAQIVDRSASIELNGASAETPVAYSSILDMTYQRVQLEWGDARWDVRASGKLELLTGDIENRCTFEAHGSAERDHQAAVASAAVPATPVAALQISFDEPIDPHGVQVSVLDALGGEIAIEAPRFDARGTQLELTPQLAWPPGEALSVVVEGAIDLAGNDAGRQILPLQLPARPLAVATGFERTDAAEAWPGCSVMANKPYARGEALAPQGQNMLACATGCNWSTYSSTTSVVAGFAPTAARTLSLQLAVVADSYGPVDLAAVEVLVHGSEGVRSVAIDAAALPAPVDELNTGFAPVAVQLTDSEAALGFWLELRFSGQCNSTGSTDPHTLLIDSLAL